MLFGWLRNQARNAVLQGVQDAAQELTREGEAPLFQLTMPQPREALPAAPGEESHSAAEGGPKPRQGRKEKAQP
jgi:hypothetical protein